MHSLGQEASSHTHTPKALVCVQFTALEVKILEMSYLLPRNDISYYLLKTKSQSVGKVSEDKRDQTD